MKKVRKKFLEHFFKNESQRTLCRHLGQQKQKTNDDASLTCYWVLAAIALLGHISLVAVHAVNVVLMRSEASSCQRFMAGFAHETLGVPWLVLVADPSRSDGLGKADILIVMSNTTG